ncbi:response regulator [Clostridium folliculivorans]|uniref:Stage 0 sporulation protein A homolog n=1 Tax=Clostridium folliculivorans TaxID=2886038 RepID=A0A9W6D9G1_9CLOT|nr:response regulator transcription factor [Clostridium folliculivorans]GKU23866.1 DNA-binding response regulator [Clostridium folliculivorans]GKU29982.1 DNA-binding response regulator [Clostridium folliculivorans]
MGLTLLIVEDEIRIRFLLRDYFLKENFKIFEAKNGKEALNIYSEEKIDLVILDIMMPELNGFEVCKKIREVSTTPIIMLTARSEEDDKLLGYELGADDYVTKPFSPKVLVAKTKALLKRTSNKTDTNIMDYDGLKINKISHEVMVYDKTINLSPKEFDLLIYLVSNEGIALTRDQILDSVWGIDYYGDLRTVDTNIKRLREKLLDKSEFITTVRGSGYKFEVKE